ncbi:uncharacterized protein LOC132714504 [Ruditapes philippinarum]|uniref:uncharacterized protein LOC132714504 n=1 Tax=Ruditapes philippinarum TaxID=129788 RepID=UPI00295AFC50|nr:uncharacterized protein LOC132714504 [Ruditapes philippinarum]
MEDEVFETNGVHPVDDLYCSRNQSSTSRRENDSDEMIQPKIRAKSARELVKNQEHLIDLLQSMKSDISKMDREASRIKEDIVRSTQLFHVMVKMKKAHHLQNVSGGYNISYSLPREIYHRYKSTSRDLNIRYLDQLSTYRPNSCRRSSLSSASSRDYSGYQGLRHSASLPNTMKAGLTSQNSNSSDDSSYSGNSATESEIDSAKTTQLSVTGSTRSVSEDSDTEDNAGSSTESASTHGPTETELSRRRSSYFFATRRLSPAPVLSDEVDL